MRRWSLLAVMLLAALVARDARAQSGDREAQRPWWERAAERRVGPYWIKTDVPAAEASRLARHLGIMYEEYARRLAALPQRAPESLHVLIFADRDEYLSVLSRRYGVNARGTGGMFFVNRMGSALALWTENLPRRRVVHVIQHEGFHQFAYSRFGGDLPVWVNEGLAEFFGESILVGNRLVLGQSKPRVLDTIKAAIEEGSYLPFRDMLQMTSGQWQQALHDGSASRQYHLARSMAHFLVYGDGKRYVGAFEGYLRRINAGVLSEQAFVESFGPDISAFEDRWKQYALNARPSAFATATERMEFLAEGCLELSRWDIYPESLEDLQRRLADIQFTRTLRKHGLGVELRYDDPAMYTIPQDDLARQQPIFVVERMERRGLPPRLRHLESLHPTPAIIRTEHLLPRGLIVRWQRNEAEADREEPDRRNMFTYDVAVR